MVRRIAVAFMALSMLGTALPPALAQNTQTAVVTATLNMREGPSTSNRVILAIPDNSAVSVIGCNSAGTWCQVNYGGATGWVSARYLAQLPAGGATTTLAGGGTVTLTPVQPAPQQTAPAPSGQVTGRVTAALNMRQGPGTNYGVILSIPNGQTVPINRCTPDYGWCEVSYSGRTGWVSARYLAVMQSGPQQGQPVADVGAQLAIQLFNFIAGQATGGAVQITTPGQTTQTASISPTSGAPGSVVTVSGTGFSPGAQVQVLAGYAPTNVSQVNTVTASASGTVRVDVQVPQATRNGDMIYFVFQTADGRQRAGADPFRVVTQQSSLVSVRGTLTNQGVECRTLRADDGTLYSLTGNLGPFVSGDRVDVTGRTASISTCQQGTTIDVTSIRSAP